MNLILARHGNTFNPSEPVVWVGSRNDLPLVAAGLAQARLLGQTLQQAGITPTAVYCGPLQRTTVYAQTVLTALNSNLKPIIDARLNEIDYGHWTGLTSEQIRTRFGDQELEAWEKQSVWPHNAGWSSSEQTLLEQIHAFTQAITQHHQNDDTILIISSNGRLRYFLNLVPGAFKKQIATQTFKVATGNICQLNYVEAAWQLKFWNKTPPAGLLE